MLDECVTSVLSVTADCFGCVAETGSSKKRARHAGATIVIADMLKNSNRSLTHLPVSDQNNE